LAGTWYSVFERLAEASKAGIFDDDGHRFDESDVRRLAERIYPAVRAFDDQNEQRESEDGNIWLGSLALAIPLVCAAEVVAWHVAWAWWPALIAIQAVTVPLVMGIVSVLVSVTLKVLRWRVLYNLQVVALLSALAFASLAWKRPDVVVALVVNILVTGASVALSFLLFEPGRMLVTSYRRVRRRVPDPTAAFIALLYRRSTFGIGDPAGVVREIERVARAQETDLAPARVPWRAGDIAWKAVAEHGQRRATWLRHRADDILMEVPDVQHFMGRGLVAASERRWDAVEEQPTRPQARRAVLGILRRVAIAGVIAAAAVLLPEWLGLKDGANTSLTVTLALVAVNALAPIADIKDAWAAAAKFLPRGR
jgi:hypothetical protein